jgi:hypothetical protein
VLATRLAEGEPRREIFKREGASRAWRPDMKLDLEVTGGFTGKAGKQIMQADTDHLKPDTAARLLRDLMQLPDQTWGQSFTSPHPKPWDFLYRLTVVDNDKEKSVQFHLNQGPPGLTQIAKLLQDLQNTSDNDAHS